MVASTPGRHAELGVARRARAPLAEVLEVVEREVVAGQVEQRVDEHRGVPGREDEPVAVRPVGVGRGVAQEAGPEGVRHRRHAHRRAGVAGVGLLDAVDGEGPDRVDRELVELLGGEGGHRGRLPWWGGGKWGHCRRGSGGAGGARPTAAAAGRPAALPARHPARSRTADPRECTSSTHPRASGAGSAAAEPVTRPVIAWSRTSLSTGPGSGRSGMRGYALRRPVEPSWRCGACTSPAPLRGRGSPSPDDRLEPRRQPPATAPRRILGPMAKLRPPVRPRPAPSSSATWPWTSSWRRRARWSTERTSRAWCGSTRAARPRTPRAGSPALASRARSSARSGATDRGARSWPRSRATGSPSVPRVRPAPGRPGSAWSWTPPASGASWPTAARPTSLRPGDLRPAWFRGAGVLHLPGVLAPRVAARARRPRARSVLARDGGRPGDGRPRLGGAAPRRRPAGGAAPGPRRRPRPPLHERSRGRRLPRRRRPSRASSRFAPVADREAGRGRRDRPRPRPRADARCGSRSPPAPVATSDTTGAGDAFDAGFLAAWLAAGAATDAGGPPACRRRRSPGCGPPARGAAPGAGPGLTPSAPRAARRPAAGQPFRKRSNQASIRSLRSIRRSGRPVIAKVCQDSG